VAVDTAGDVYAADTANNQITELPAGSATQQIVPFTGLDNPHGVAVDTGGDVYAADTANDQIVELPAGSATQQILPFTGLNNPRGVAVDAAGNVYAADTANNQITELSGYVATTAAVTSVAPAPATTGQPFTIAVSVTPASGTLAPGGQVTVSDGGTGSCTATLTAGTGPAAGTGTGSCQLTENTAGSYTLTAAYAGQGAFTSSSGTGSVTVDTAPAFTTDSPPLSATAGQHYGYTFAASGVPAPDYGLASGAPSWLSIDASTGTLSGTVPAGTTSFSYGVTAANPAGTAAAGPFTVQVSPPAGPFVTLLFSRTEMGAADGCVSDDTGIEPLGTVVAPYLQSLGMTGTGTLVTGKTNATARVCAHSGDSLTASWDDATDLAKYYGWSFVSHTATYPANMSKLTPAQLYAETCGSAATIEDHGLPGAHGMIAYPGAQPLPQTVQAGYSANCFAWGRRYNSSGLTKDAAGTTAPYWQETEAVSGGACNTPSAPCSIVSPRRYTSPAQVIARIGALRPGQWFTLQAFILVTGTSPPYTRNKTRWDCTSNNPNLHWTNDEERYCYSDWQQIVAAVAARHDIVVTDPLTVGMAFGRPATYPMPNSRR
jgi:hypothetical protein